MSLTRNYELDMMIISRYYGFIETMEPVKTIRIIGYSPYMTVEQMVYPAQDLARGLFSRVFRLKILRCFSRQADFCFDVRLRQGGKCRIIWEIKLNDEPRLIRKAIDDLVHK